MWFQADVGDGLCGDKIRQALYLHVVSTPVLIVVLQRAAVVMILKERGKSNFIINTAMSANFTYNQQQGHQNFEWEERINSIIMSNKNKNAFIPT